MNVYLFNLSFAHFSMSSLDEVHENIKSGLTYLVHFQNLYMISYVFWFSKVMCDLEN